MNKLYLWQIAVLVAAIVALMWIAALLVSARLTGWSRLVRRYPAVRESEGERIWFGLTFFRRFAYRNLVYARASATHLHIAMVWPLCFFGHAPFSVPWADISAEPGRLLAWRKVISFRLAGVPDVPLHLLTSDGERVIEASRGHMQPNR